METTTLCFGCRVWVCSAAAQPLGGRLDELEDRLQRILLLGAVELVAVDDRLRLLVRRPPGRPRPAHDLPFAIGNADQIADLHLPQTQRHVAAADFAADLDDAGGFAHPAMADDAGGEIGFGQDLPQDDFHLFDIHISLFTIEAAKSRNIALNLARPAAPCPSQLPARQDSGTIQDMFGLGLLEIAVLAGCLILLFGIPQAGRMLGRLLRTWRRVEEVRGQLRTPFNLKNFLLRKGREFLSKE